MNLGRETKNISRTAVHWWLAGLVGENCAGSRLDVRRAAFRVFGFWPSETCEETVAAPKQVMPPRFPDSDELLKRVSVSVELCKASASPTKNHVQKCDIHLIFNTNNQNRSDSKWKWSARSGIPGADLTITSKS
jgi:hypothetical protein